MHIIATTTTTKQWEGSPVTLDLVLYPLVTHDPNMLKNKSRGNLVGKIKVSLPEWKSENFC